MKLLCDPGQIWFLLGKTRLELRDLGMPCLASLNFLIPASFPAFSDPEKIFLCLFSKHQCTCQRLCYSFSFYLFSCKLHLIENIYHFMPIYCGELICFEMMARIFPVFSFEEHLIKKDLFSSVQFSCSVVSNSL